MCFKQNKMKEKKFKNLSFLKENILSREQMKNLIGGYGGQFGCPESQLPYLCINTDGSSDCFLCRCRYSSTIIYL